MKHVFPRVLTSLLLLCLVSGALPAAAQLRIFNASPSALPREVITLQGNFGPAAKIHLSRGADGTVITPAILVQSQGHATVAIPANLALDLYQVWVAEGAARSPAVLINRARGMHYNSPDVVPGGSVRIFGRNLQLPGSTPRVRFVQQDNTNSTEASVVATGSDAYKLVVKVPGALLPGKTYDVYVTNGFGAALGETKVEQPLKVIPTTANYFNLPVDWGHRFDYYKNIYNVKTDPRLTRKAVGDGVADDQAALQQCLTKAAQAGGGVVYLPAGSYKLLASGLEIPSRVMLVGAGINQTFLRYGYAGDGLGIYVAPNATTAGLADLSVENVSDDGTWKSNLRANQVTEFILQRVRLKLNKGWWLELADSDKLSITNCEITQGITSTTGYRGPVRFDGSQNIVFAHNTVTYAVDALNFGYTAKGGARNIVFEHNTINRDGSARWAAGLRLINHVVTFNFTSNVANLNNRYQVINGDPQNINDGETILAEQGGGYTPDEAVGTVTGATAMTLTDNTKAWGNLVQLGVGVSIVHGKGMGQWRPITSRTATTLTLGEAWEVVPDATSRYSIYTWGAQNWLVQGNTMEGNQRGITIYHNATKDVVIADNVLTNNGSIDITPYQKDVNNSTTTVGLLPVYNVQIVNNRVSDVNGKMGVFIGVHPVQHVQTRTFGTSVIGLEVRNNNVTAHTPNTVARVDDNYPNGYLNYLEYHTSGQNYVDEGIPAIIGSIFQNNTATNCDNALYLNSASYNTLVCEMKLVNATSQLKDSKLMGASHASVRTASCADVPTVPSTQPPVADPKKNTPIPRNAGATSLLPLTGSSPNGEVTSFSISTLPTAAEGTLYVKGQPAAKNAPVAVDQANQLSFEPSTNYMGNATFTYTSTDNMGLVSAAAPFVVPVIVTLPVELMEFTVEAKNSSASLTWSTASELNSSHFVVERSGQGGSFVPVGQVRSQGTTKTPSAYTFVDAGVGSRMQGNVYYRLKQVDTDSSSRYSPVRTIAFAAQALATVQVYPNPTTHQLHVGLAAPGAKLTIFSATGVLLSATQTAGSISTLDVQQLPPGAYCLRIEPSTGSGTQHWFVKY